MAHPVPALRRGTEDGRHQQTPAGPDAATPVWVRAERQGRGRSGGYGGAGRGERAVPVIVEVAGGGVQRQETAGTERVDRREGGGVHIFECAEAKHRHGEDGDGPTNNNLTMPGFIVSYIFLVFLFFRTYSPFYMFCIKYNISFFLCAVLDSLKCQLQILCVTRS